MWPNVRDFYTFSPFVFLPSSFSTAFNLAMSLKIKTFLDILKAKSAFFIVNVFLNCEFLYCKVRARQIL